MIDQRCAAERHVVFQGGRQKGDADQPSHLPSKVEQAHTVRDFGSGEIAEANDRNGDEQQTHSQPAQHQGRHEIGIAAFRIGARQEPHGGHEDDDAERHDDHGRRSQELNDRAARQQSKPYRQSAWEQHQAGIAGRELQDFKSEGRDQERAAEQRETGNEAHDEAECEFLMAKDPQVDQR
ncbi:hypothetical protein D9M73_162630 [compost metagenome]